MPGNLPASVMSSWTESVEPLDDEGSLYRDVDWNSTEDEYPPDTPGCQLYNFIMYAVFGGSICLLGCVGNIVAFIVFWRDKVKTSTSLLFQVQTNYLFIRLLFLYDDKLSLCYSIYHITHC